MGLYLPIYEQNLNLIRQETLREKCPYSELFWSKCRGMRTRITPNTNTFYAVKGWCNPGQNKVREMLQMDTLRKYNINVKSAKFTWS